jgi:hypothetical protein
MRRHYVKRTLLAAVFSALALGANAATLDFSGTICSGSACSNGSAIDQSYGDIAGEIDVRYDADRATGNLDNLFFWSTGYETLSGVAYGKLNGGGLSIALVAEDGFDVMLTGFDIAPYINRVRDTAVQIIDLATNTILVNDTYTPLSVDGVTSYSGSWMSTEGLQINLGPDAWDVAIDNIQFASIEESLTPIPLPAGGLLLLSGLFGMAAFKRRRRG